MLWTPFLGVSLVFMLLYVWSREFPNAQINIYGLVALKVCFQLPLKWQVFTTSITSIIIVPVPWYGIRGLVSLCSAGLLPTMGNACIGCYIRFTDITRPSWDPCWTSLLLPDRAASSCWWEGHAKNTKMGVSFCLHRI